MIKDITQSVLAILIVLGALYAAISGNSAATQYLIGIAGLVVGFYFKTATDSAIKAAGKASITKTSNPAAPVSPVAPPTIGPALTQNPK